jgi:hypothetical protein
LFRAALIERNAAARSLSLHRLVQTAVLDELDELDGADKSRYLRFVIELMWQAFPSAWPDKGGDGFTWTTWDKCQRCLPHMTHISRQLPAQKMTENDVLDLIELLLRSAWSVEIFRRNAGSY